MEQLSQNELIGLVTLIRDKKEYQESIIKYKLLNELHMIVHHEQTSKNKYHGTWSDELKNKVIHQILYRIIPKDERENFTKDHPLLSKINELIEDNKRGDEISFRFMSSMNGWCDEIRALKKHIKRIETTEINEYIEKIKNLEYTIRHYEENFIRPLIKLNWIDRNMIIYNGLIKKPDITGTGDRKTIHSRYMCNVGSLDMVLPHRLYFEKLCELYSNEYFMNGEYQEKISELKKEIKTLKQENENIRKDNVDKLKGLFNK
tara:strand:+ start:1119 stop:1901 length:783 start_codon:yes stop_codon:yes gene_type:complete